MSRAKVWVRTGFVGIVTLALMAGAGCFDRRADEPDTGTADTPEVVTAETLARYAPWLPQWNADYASENRIAWGWDGEAGMVWAFVGVPEGAARRPRLLGVDEEAGFLVLRAELIVGDAGAAAASVFPAAGEPEAARLLLDGRPPGIWLGPVRWDWEPGAEEWRADPVATIRAQQERLGLSPKAELELEWEGVHDPSGGYWARVSISDRGERFSAQLVRSAAGRWFIGTVIWGNACTSFPRYCAD